jgi:hypothetical protein
MQKGETDLKARTKMYARRIIRLFLALRPCDYTCSLYPCLAETQRNAREGSPWSNCWW